MAEHAPISDSALDQIFRTARTQNAWLDTPVSDTLLRAVYELVALGPTTANSNPTRIVFVKTEEGKQRLAPLLSEGNRAKTMKAPVTAIIGYDTKFFEKLPQLFPHNPGSREWFAHNEQLAEATAFRNSSLDGAYFIIACRALGLDTGPMSGFNNAGVDAEFFAGTTIKSNFICAIGHGDPKAVFPRSPRLSFEEACQIV